MVVLETDADRPYHRARGRPLSARAELRQQLARLGFTDADIANGGDRLIDADRQGGGGIALVLPNTMLRAPTTSASGAHRDAGDLDAAMAGWRQLAPSLSSLAR